MTEEHHDSHNRENEGDVATEGKLKLAKPRQFRVLLHNDDYTTMEFVVRVLMNVFRHTEQKAVEIMMHVHQKGVGVAGVYSYEIAETKAHKVVQMARDHEFPLRCTVEPDT